MTVKVTRPERAELLMPAGNLQKLKMAVLYGADVIYLGTPDMSLRTKSAFTLEEVVEGVGRLGARIESQRGDLFGLLLHHQVLLL